MAGVSLHVLMPSVPYYHYGIIWSIMGSMGIIYASICSSLYPWIPGYHDIRGGQDMQVDGYGPIMPSSSPCHVLWDHVVLVLWGVEEDIQPP